MTPENLEPYEENLAKYGSKAKNRKDPSFADALKQAQEPSIAEALIRRRAGNLPSSDNDDGAEEGFASNSDDEDDVEMQSADSDAQPAARSKAGSRRKANGGRGKQPRAGNKRTSLGTASSDDDEPATATPKRSRTTARDRYEHGAASPGASTKRDSDDSRSATKDSPRSVTPDHKASPGANKDEAKGERGSKSHQHSKNRNKSYQTLMQLRHRLQKTIIKGPIPDDLTLVHDVFRKLEEFDMTLELIQETKLGKVMRIIAVSDKLGDAPEEAFDIKGRAIRLADKWRMLIVKRRDGSAEPAIPEEQLSRKSAELEARGERQPDAIANIPTDMPTPDQSHSMPDTPLEATSPTTATASLALMDSVNDTAAASSDAARLEQQSRAAPSQGIHSI
ncbi:hypothetical protein IWW37_003030 [Coemansia sp. RSA 2050]|nr:hypothetical protein IWW37_003030 [Coemansia sp. RSA 2050]KAJ2736642.1 hypothetical protein IW152_000611 [Coemansia sp. BCRC 34962]